MLRVLGLAAFQWRLGPHQFITLADLMWPSALSNQAYVSENAVCVTCAVSLSGGELVLLNPEWDCLRLLLLSIANMDSEKQINV